MLNFFVFAENLDIGNGYGVPGGGAYDKASRPLMFSIASESSPSKLLPEHERGAFSQSTTQEASIHSAGFNGGSGSLSVKKQGPQVSEKSSGKQELPDFLKERLKARGILKDDSRPEVVSKVSFCCVIFISRLGELFVLLKLLSDNGSIAGII